MAEISPLLPETPSPPLPDVKLQNHFAANKTRKEQLEMFNKTSKQQKMFTGGKTSKEELLNMKAGKEENLFSPPPRVRNPSKRDRTRKHSSGEFLIIISNANLNLLIIFSGKSDPFAFPADENSSPEVAPLKKIKLEGAAELKEKVTVTITINITININITTTITITITITITGAVTIMLQ